VGIRELTIPKRAIREYERALEDLEEENTVSAIAPLERAVKIAPHFYEVHATLAAQ